MRSEWFCFIACAILAYLFISGLLSIIYIPNYSSYLCVTIALGFASSFKVKDHSVASNDHVEKYKSIDITI